MREIPLALTFDDVSLVPQYSQIRSRSQPTTKKTLGKFYSLNVPFFAAPMNSVVGASMVKAMHATGGDSVIHRYMKIEDQCNLYREVEREKPFVAIGASGDFQVRALALYKFGCKKFCVDVANGHNILAIEAVSWLRKKIPESLIMAGNVCTIDGCERLAAAGANLLRVGIGPGSACSTRKVTGHGVPQLSVIEECAAIKNTRKDVYIISDGGIRGSGDIVKCFAAGADAVMFGGLLAGSSKTPGEPIKDPETGVLYKYYSGMASERGRQDWFSRTQTSFVPEGASFKVSLKGETEDILKELIEGLKVGMSYSGVLSLEDLHKKAKFVMITDNGRKEGNPNARMHK